VNIGIRSAVASDKESIASFTQDTFAWGDYVEDVFDHWLADPVGRTVVAVDEDDIAIAIARWTVLSPTEVWGQGARVHPGYRRQGISTRLTEAGAQWARDHGANVLRLVTEDWNTAAQGQVQRSGFHEVSRWKRWDRPVGDAAPNVSGNGGNRVSSDERLMLAGESEVGPAFLAWSAGPLAPASHGLISEHWTWRQMRPEDLASAARRKALWSCPAGWLIGDAEDEPPNTFSVSWVATAPDDAHRLLRAAIDRASSDGAERITVMLPELDWIEKAAKRAALTPRHVLLVYERPVTPRERAVG
jgi:GNAT superfamily N-acetyltransferase